MLADNSERKPAGGGTLLAENTDRRPEAQEKIFRGQTPEADEESPVPPTPPEPFRTAAADDLGGFLPPQSVASHTAAAAPADGREPRPTPLDAFRSRERSRGNAATETADERPVDGRRPLPRTTRVEATDSAGESDFFGATSGPVGARPRGLGMTSRAAGR
jgi:hypothetical protein